MRARDILCSLRVLPLSMNDRRGLDPEYSQTLHIGK
jgi:hypothetical protein